MVMTPLEASSSFYLHMNWEIEKICALIDKEIAKTNSLILITVSLPVRDFDIDRKIIAMYNDVGWQTTISYDILCLKLAKTFSQNQIAP